jgi:predicted DNA-binding transcriptional regulator AlpA
MDLSSHTEMLAECPPIKQRPEWIRIEAAVRLFGISRSKIYELIADRKIKSFCLRERNKIKGIRLISFDSLSEFLDAEAKAQAQREEASEPEE